MTQFQGQLAVYDVASILVTGIADALAATPAGVPARVCVVPGQVAYDQCDCDGLLAVSPQRFFVSDEFPEGAVGQGLIRTSPCDLPWLVAEYLVTMLRCAPQPIGQSLAPTCVALDASAQTLLVDSYVSYTTAISILCELRGDDRIIDYVMGEQITRGPEGACVGTEFIALVGFMR